MNIECPTCGNEINVRITTLSNGGWYEPPEFDYDFNDEHICQETWDDDTQKAFDEKVYEAAIDERNSEP